MKRKLFIQQIGSLAVLAACGKGKETIEEILEKPVTMRFAVASDWHYGEAETDYIAHFEEFLEGFSAFHKDKPCDFCVFNGDIIHNDPAFLEPASKLLKRIPTQLYVSHGNHDRVTEETWKATWGIPFNHEIKIKGQVILIADTSNILGAELCADIPWFRQKLDKNANAENIFVFQHIHPYERLECAGFNDMLSDFSNVRAVFNGHDHNDESIKTIQGVPFMFNGRIGGSWGTFDREFRVVELREDNSLITYLMTPFTKKKQATINARSLSTIQQ